MTEKEDLRKLLPERFTPGLSLLLMEEYAREAGAEMAKRMPREKEASTKILDRMDETVRYKLDLVKSDVRGKIREITIRSPSPRFSLLVMTDGVRRIDRPYSELAELSQYSEFIDAYESNGSYILHVGEVSWVRDGLATLYVDVGPITFQHIWVVVEEYF